MTRSIALSLLAQGNNGNEILSILDVIATEEAEQSIDTPTLDVIEFWWYNLLRCSAVIRGAPYVCSSDIRDSAVVAPWRLWGRAAKRGYKKL